jgi:hypothetical protein
LPGWLLSELEHPPKVQRHQWLFRTALKLLRYRDAYATLGLLAGAATCVGRHVPARELKEAVRDAARWRIVQGSAVTSVQKLQQEMRWPANFEEIAGIVRNGPKHHDLWELSPEKLSIERRHTERIIDQLFPENSLLCCGLQSWEFATRRREVWRGRLHTLPFIVPNSMTSVWGRTDDGQGHKSEHTLSNTGPRQHLVVEFDFAEFASDGVSRTVWAPLVRNWKQVGFTVADACTALLIHLGRSAPLALIVNSGGKSLHGWFPCRDTDEYKLRNWMRCAVRIGACTSTWCRSQFVRMPDGTRENGYRQAIEYFNPTLVTKKAVTV